MTALRFKAADVLRIVEHSLAAPQQRPIPYTADPVTAPSVLLVKDRGVYLMSNGTPADVLESPQLYVVYAESYNPNKMNTEADRDEVWRRQQDLSRDDFVEALPWAEQIRNQIADGREFIVITFDDEELDLVE